MTLFSGAEALNVTVTVDGVASAAFLTLTPPSLPACHISLRRRFPCLHPFSPFPLPGYEGAELNMELYWILLFSSVCPLAWGQGVYGKEPTIYKCFPVITSMCSLISAG